MKPLVVACLALALSACVAPLSKRDIVAVEAGSQAHRSLTRACRPLGDVSGFSWQGGQLYAATGRHNAKQSMLNGAPAETTHIAYGAGMDIGWRARGEAFACPKGYAEVSQ